MCKFFYHSIISLDLWPLDLRISHHSICILEVERGGYNNVFRNNPHTQAEMKQNNKILSCELQASLTQFSPACMKLEKYCARLRF